MTQGKQGSKLPLALLLRVAPEVWDDFNLPPYPSYSIFDPAQLRQRLHPYFTMGDTDVQATKGDRVSKAAKDVAAAYVC